MLIEKFFNIVEKTHHNRIINHIEALDIEEIIDVGAHKGEFLSCALKIKKIKKIYAFEPQSKANKILLEKFNKLQNVEIFNYALDKEISKKKIYLNNFSKSSTLSKFNNDSLYLKIKNFLTKSKNNFEESYDVNTNTINNIFKNISMDKALLKIDAEGYEINVLEGAKEKIKEVPFVLIEHQFGNHYENSNTEMNHNFLIQNNFKILKSFYPLSLNYKDVLYEKIY